MRKEKVDGGQGSVMAEIRRPRYLDVSLLRDLGDQLDLEWPEKLEVSEKVAGGKSWRVGLSRGVEARRDSTQGHERTESFLRSVGPVRLLDIVIDGLRSAGALSEFSGAPGQALRARSAVEATGHLVLSPASEGGALLEGLMPILSAGLGERDTIDNSEVKKLMDENPSLMSSLLGFDGAQKPAAPAVLLLEPEDGEMRLMMVVRSDHLYNAESYEELEGPMTVLGVVDRVLPEGVTVSMDSYLFPSMNRSMRRALARDGLDEILGSVGELEGRSIDLSALQFHGPGAMISVAAIYP